MSEAVALGEALIDFTPAGCSASGNPLFERNPGGAPANVLAQLARLGADTAFIGKVGDDIFGRALRDTFRSAGIGTDGLILSRDYNTTLAFVQLDGRGDRSFCFVRSHGADKMLEQGDVDYRLLGGAGIFYFGGVALTEEPARSTALNAAAEARRRGLLVAYDPNYRPLLWKEDAAPVLKQGLRFADVLKVSDLECRMLSGKEDLEAGSALLSEQYDIPLVFVTMGAEGSAFRFGGVYRRQPTFNVKTIDTTGAGDSFFGSALYRILRAGKKVKELSADEIDGFMRFANAAGSLVTTKKGAILSMPDLTQIEDLLARAD